MKAKFRTSRLVLAAGLTLSAVPVLAEGELPGALEKVQEKVEAKVYELLDKDMATIKFEKGSDVLTSSEHDALRAFVTAAEKNGKIDRFIVAAWADEEMPKGDAKLSEKQRHLASNRSHVVEQALRDAGARSVEGFSMAEKANWIQKAFNTEGAQLKGAGRIKTAEERLTAEIGERLRSKGGPGAAVIVAKYHPGTAAH